MKKLLSLLLLVCFTTTLTITESIAMDLKGDRYDLIIEIPDDNQDMRIFSLLDRVNRERTQIGSPEGYTIEELSSQRMVEILQSFGSGAGAIVAIGGAVYLGAKAAVLGTATIMGPFATGLARMLGGGLFFKLVGATGGSISGATVTALIAKNRWANPFAQYDDVQALDADFLADEDQELNDEKILETAEALAIVLEKLDE